MNYLELCQRLVREAGSISGSIVSVAGQSGEFARVVNWVANAYGAIQTEHPDWEFLRNDVTFDAHAGIGNYTAESAGVAQFGEWRFRSNDWRCYSKAIGVLDEQPVRFINYDRFRSTYGYGAQREASGRPQVVTQRPDMSLQFWPVPDATYVIVGEQYRAPYDLTENTSQPVFPARYHNAIVWRAMMYYAADEGDSTLFAHAQNEFLPLLAKLEDAYLPDIEAGGPLA